MPERGYWARDVRQINTCPRKNPIFQLFSPETRRRETFVSKILALVITILPTHLSNKQTDPTNEFVEMIVKVRKFRGQGGVSYLFRKKILKFPLFIWRKLVEKNVGKEYHGTSLNWIVFHWLVQKHQQFQAYCRDTTQKYSLCPLKNPKIEFFSYSRKKNWITRGENFGDRKIGIWYIMNAS